MTNQVPLATLTAFDAVPPLGYPPGIVIVAPSQPQSGKLRFEVFILTRDGQRWSSIKQAFEIWQDDLTRLQQLDPDFDAVLDRIKPWVEGELQGVLERARAERLKRGVEEPSHWPPPYQLVQKERPWLGNVWLSDGGREQLLVIAKQTQSQELRQYLGKLNEIRSEALAPIPISDKST